MKGYRKCWICTVKPRYVAMMKSGEKTIEVRTRVPRDMKKGDGFYIMEKGANTLALVARVGGITTYDRMGLYMNLPTRELMRTCLSLAELDEYIGLRPQANFIEITVEWIPSEAQRKYLTPEHFGYRCMPQGVLPIPGKWIP